jgi:hypothetical protein
VLAYVSEPFAYFVDDIAAAHGDDWNDAPHDCNAGPPYGKAFTKVAYDGDDLEVVGGGFPSGLRWGALSVDAINRGEAPWIVQVRWGAPSEIVDGREVLAIGVQVPSGVTIAEFERLIAQASGRVYRAPEPGDPLAEAAARAVQQAYERPSPEAWPGPRGEAIA